MTLKGFRRRGQCAVVAACSAALFPGTSKAGISFDPASNVKIAHYAEEGNAGTSGIINLVPPLSGSMPVPSSYQYKKTLNLNGGSSAASASIGNITNSQNVGFTFASGTGITQSDPGVVFSNPAILRFDLNGIWNVTSGGYGPISYGYVAFTVAGTIPTGDTASISLNMTWKDENNVSLRPALNQTLNFTHSSTLPFSFSNSGSLNGGAQIASGKEVHVSGTIAFRASDPGATINLAPTDFEFSAAPPTYNFQNASGDYFSPQNWVIDSAMAADFPGFVYPNFGGARAYFGPTSNSATDLAIADAPVTLGVLDINRGGLNFSGSAALTFAVPTGDAVCFARNTGNFTGSITDPVNGTVKNFTSQANLIAAPLNLASSLDVIVDSEAPLLFQQPVSGAGGINKSGLGELILQNSNTFAGGITVNAGTITAAADGCFGNNIVNVNGGLVNVQTPNPFSGPVGTIAVNSNGQVNLGATGGNVNYNVASLGAVSGGSAQLQSLTIGSNFFPATGAMIAHTSFNPAIGTGNPVGLTNVPTYIFGISSNFTSAGQSIVVGSLSNSPWLGFGSDQSPHTFGGGAGQTLGISGNAQLVALGGALTVNAPITGTAADKINKNGAGLVIINSAANTFNGLMEVQTGPISMNAGWQGPITVDAGASLGGTGNLNSNLTFQNNNTNTSGAFFRPGLLGPTPYSASAPNTIEGPGTLHTTGNVSFSSLTHLVYNLNTANVAGGADNDLLVINGNLGLGGILDIIGGPDFTGGVYTLMTFTGNFTGGAPTLGNVPLDDFPGMQVIVQQNAGGGGSVLLAVPEPATFGLAALGAAMLAGRRKKRR